MYRWIRPQIAIPVHGEARHLHEHLAFARRLGVPQPFEVKNGDLVRLAPAPAEVIDEVPTGRLVLENDGTDRRRGRSVPHPPPADEPRHGPGRPGARSLRHAAGRARSCPVRRGGSRRASPVSGDAVQSEIEDASRSSTTRPCSTTSRSGPAPHRRAPRPQAGAREAADHRGADHPARQARRWRTSSTRTERPDDRPSQPRRDRGAGPGRGRRAVSRPAGRAVSPPARSPRMA